MRGVLVCVSLSVSGPISIHFGERSTGLILHRPDLHPPLLVMSEKAGVLLDPYIVLWVQKDLFPKPLKVPPLAKDLWTVKGRYGHVP